MGRMGFWIRNARPVALPQSLIPGITALALAVGMEDASVWLAILAVFGVSMAHLCMNLFDDYFDYKKKESGYRNTLAREGIRARTVKCPYLLSGEATMRQLLRAALIFGCLAIIPGCVILVFRGWPILALASVAVVLGLSYSGGPLSLSYHGFGELVIGLMFGPLLMMGVYYASCGKFDWCVLWLSIGMGMLVTNIVYTHSVLDYEADIRAGKSTLAAVLKKNVLRYLVSVALSVCPYMIVICLILEGQLGRWYLLILLLLPWSLELLISIGRHFKNPQEFKKTVGWWGPMENWKAIETAGIDWFMFRWYLSRNMLMGFGIFCVIGTILQ